MTGAHQMTSGRLVWRSLGMLRPVRARLTGVIRGYARDRTCVVISHDMDFIAAVADRILVLEHGRIAQVADHHALMAEGGLYKRLHEAQNVDPGLVYPRPSEAD
jgi:ATP-binding cassette subfamily B protein